MKRINIGSFVTVNPYTRKHSVKEVSPENIHTIVFWSKNFGPFIKHHYGEELLNKGYNLFFNFTINSRDKLLEPNLPTLNTRLKQLEHLAETFGPDSINWRFDPVCHYKINGIAKNNFNDFLLLSEAISKTKVKRCISSFTDIYKKIQRRLSVHPGLELVNLTMNKKIDAVLRMEKILSGHDIQLMLCCEDIVLKALPGNAKTTASSCINNRLLKELYDSNISLAKDTGQRTTKGCECNKSFDIGSYEIHPCRHNCLYCYASPVKSPAERKNFEE